MTGISDTSPVGRDRMLRELVKYLRDVEAVVRATTHQLFSRLHNYHPPVNLYDRGDSYLLVIAVPGVKPESLDVEAGNESIVIRGVREPTPPEAFGDELGEVVYETSLWGPFEEEIYLPSTIRPKEVHAVLTQGLLFILAPKSQPSVKVDIQ